MKRSLDAVEFGFESAIASLKTSQDVIPVYYKVMVQ